MLHRHLNVGGNVELNMDTLLHNYTLQTNQPSLPGEGTVVLPGNSEGMTWAASLIQFANEGGFFLIAQEILRPRGLEPLSH